jgi:hypothetical protein
MEVGTAAAARLIAFLRRLPTDAKSEPEFDHSGENNLLADHWAGWER